MEREEGRGRRRGEVSCRVCPRPRGDVFNLNKKTHTPNNNTQHTDTHTNTHSEHTHTHIQRARDPKTHEFATQKFARHTCQRNDSWYDIVVAGGATVDT